jgi:ubiquinone/menaquinone biosynthesis C-methylase UbiE
VSSESLTNMRISIGSWQSNVSLSRGQLASPEACPVGNECDDTMRDDRTPVTGIPVGAQFHERAAAHWSQGYQRRGFKRRLAEFRAVLSRNVFAGESWLDLGCGSGVLTKELLARGADVVAVDGSPAMLTAAEDGISAPAGQVVTWLQSDVADLAGVADVSVDGILCSSVIEYVEDPARVLRECARVMRDGGKLILSVPAKGSPVRILQKIIRRLAKLVGRETFRYLKVSRFELQPKALQSFMRQGGFAVVNTTGFDPVLPRSIIRRIRPGLLIVEARKEAPQSAA